MPKVFTRQLNKAFKALEPIIMDVQRTQTMLQNNQRSIPPIYFARRSRQLQSRLHDLNRCMGLIIELLHEQRIP